MLQKASEQGYMAVVNMGSRGLTYATNVIVSTAVKVWRYRYCVLVFDRVCSFNQGLTSCRPWAPAWFFPRVHFFVKKSWQPFFGHRRQNTGVDCNC